MSLKGFVCAFSMTAVLSVSSNVLGQAAAPFNPPDVRISRGSSSKALTGVSRAGTIEIVRDYLRTQGHTQGTLGSLALVSEGRSPRTGVTHARFVQRMQGLDVYGVYVKAAVDARGQLTSVIENLVPVRTFNKLVGAEGAALSSTLRHLYGSAVASPGMSHREGNRAVFNRTAFFYRGPRVTRVAVPYGAAQLRMGFVVETWSAKDNLLHETLVGSDNSVIAVEQRTNSDTYNVFTKNPAATPQAVLPGAGAGNDESPHGWLGEVMQTMFNISGNNVHAYLDADANNAPDPASGGAVANGQFETSANLSAQPSSTTNRAVAVQNLFYLNNVLHDVLYRHGFDEAQGNFQIDNFGNGGFGNDPVNAEAQDGSGTDNANFATPGDGSPPRMQMYLWNPPNTHQVVVNASEVVYEAAGSSLGPPLSPTGIFATLAVVNDGTAPTGDACQRLARNALTNKIALIDRGTCTFADKILNAQRAGAVAVIIANNDPGGVFTIGGTGTGITIPSVFVTKASGTALKGAGAVAVTVRLTNPAPLSRDGDVDSDIVYHEYGHGLTWRMIGSMGGVMSGAIGEGMSDVLAVLMNEDDRIGEYSGFDPNGIRTAPYHAYPRTYKAFSGTEVHLDGEIYGAIGWKLSELFDVEGFTNDDLLDDLVEGMNYTPANPKFEQMRDGILQAVAGTGRECLIWKGFAAYGVGVGASATFKGTKITIKESFTVPATCP